jgi:hypothetical protein
MRRPEPLMSLTVVGQKVELRSEIEIRARLPLVWEVITNLRAYGEWNPFIVDAEGQLQEGASIAITVNYPGNRERNFRRRVLKLTPPHELRWCSTLILRAFAYSEQFFQLRAVSDDSLRLTIGENFRGLLAPRTQFELSQISQGLTLMNQAIKRRSEAMQAG